MKRLLIATAVLVALSALAAEMQIGLYTQENLGAVNQPLPRRIAAGGVYSVEDYPMYRPPLPQGAGRQETEAYCGTCHSIRYITMQPVLPAETWEAIVKKMVDTYGQEIPAEAQPRITRYLQTHFGPARKQ